MSIFLFFQDGGHRHVGFFKISNFCRSEWSRVPNCVIVQNFVAIDARWHPTLPVDFQIYLMMKVFTKFEVDTSIRYLVIALLLLIRYVTL